MKLLRALMVVVCVFAPFVVTGFAIARSAHPLELIQRFTSLDTLWFIYCALMMVGMYYFLVSHMTKPTIARPAFADLDADEEFKHSLARRAG